MTETSDAAAGRTATIIADLRDEPSWSPGWDEAWWWLVLPVALGIAILAVYAVAPQFYLDHILPEGYGVLEVSHFFVPITGCIICLGLLGSPVVRGSGLVLAAVIVFALACLYIAGEEMSWGQHWLHWRTPEYWANINRQDETNLHNVSPWFNHRPRLLLEIAITVGGLVLPLVERLRGRFAHPLLALLTPPAALVPTTLVYLGFKLVDHLTKRGIAPNLLERPAESVETFMYLFILYYLVVFRRRISALDAAGVRRVGL